MLEGLTDPPTELLLKRGPEFLNMEDKYEEFCPLLRVVPLDFDLVCCLATSNAEIPFACSPDERDQRSPYFCVFPF